MLCRFQVQKALRWCLAITFVVSGIVVCSLFASSMAALGLGIIMIGGGIAIANATFLEEDLRYRRQHI